jgi:hypothetical protein
MLIFPPVIFKLHRNTLCEPNMQLLPQEPVAGFYRGGANRAGGKKKRAAEAAHLSGVFFELCW